MTGWLLTIILLTQATAPASAPATNSLGMKFVRIEPGEFLMGSPETEEGHADEEAQHRVKITRPFMIATTEVTQAQWKAVMGDNPSHRQGDDLPVEQISWNEATEFCKKLSEKEGKTYRLPTEGEWEYACRAGTKSAYYLGEDNEALNEAGWWEGNANRKTHPPAQKKPNAWGLYDMHGNVWEFCSDGYAELAKEEATDPAGDANSDRKVVKGGGWDNGWSMNRAANRGSVSRDSRLVDVGLRICIDIPARSDSQ